VRHPEDIKYHFLLAKEITASSLVVAMLNQSPALLSVSEETFGLYLYDKYKDTREWDDQRLMEFADDFLLMHKKNIDLFMEEEQVMRSSLLKWSGSSLAVEELIKVVYLNFYPNKEKGQVETVIDKQIDYLFHLPELLGRFPNSRFIILSRHPLSNVESCIGRGLNGSTDPVFHAELWNTYYVNVLPYLNDDRFLFVKYENLVEEPALFLKQICEHINADYTDDFLSYKESLEELMSAGQDRVTNEFSEKFKRFHAGLFQEVKADYGKDKLSLLGSTEKRVVEELTREVAVQLGYAIDAKDISLSTTDRIQIKKAQLAKKKLLSVYWKIPVSMKLWIKRNRKQSIDV
jgi:hypothetical protein